MVTELSKPCVRKIDGVMIRVDADGVAIKGFRKHHWYKLSFAQFIKAALLANPPYPGLSAAEWDNPLKTIGAKR